MQVKKITIVCRGDSEDEVFESFNEAARLIREGNVTGGNSREDAAFYFDVTENVPANEVPA